MTASAPANVKPRLRCAYEDCPEAHPMANESTYEQVTCPTCRTSLGLPPMEIYNQNKTGVMGQKPRAGEHTKGPWKAVKDTVHIAAGAQIADCSFTVRAEANARRIVACVNFLEGIETERLTPELHSIYDNLGNLLAERDQLRAREAELVEALEYYAKLPGESMIAKAALSKVRG